MRLDTKDGRAVPAACGRSDKEDQSLPAPVAETASRTHHLKFDSLIRIVNHLFSEGTNGKRLALPASTGEPRRIIFY